MVQRRSPFSYGAGSGGDGQRGAKPTTAMPFTGTGTDGANAYTELLPDQQIDPVLGESPATLRRRIMPVAGQGQVEPDILTAVQQMLQARKAGM